VAYFGHYHGICTKIDENHQKRQTGCPTAHLRVKNIPVKSQYIIGELFFSIKTDIEFQVKSESENTTIQKLQIYPMHEV
jgi:hypothetical protein